MPSQNQKQGPSPRTLQDIEERSRPSGRRWQIGLGRLMIACNFAGLILAIIVATRGMALAIAIFFGILIGFLLPAVVVVGVLLVELKEAWVGRRPIPLASQRDKKMPRCPLDE